VLALNGTLSGTFITTHNPVSSGGASTLTNFQGSGTIAGLGQVKVTGLLATSVTATGQLSTVDTFTLTNAQGSVTIRLTNTAPKPGTNGTTESTFSIVNATGAFQGDNGTGTADLQMIALTVPVSPPTVSRGVFTLTLRSSSTVV
jgi:hypothetical protein